MSDPIRVSFEINGRRYEVSVPPNVMLSDLLRERFNLTSVKISCDQGVCGACTVLIDGKPAIGCMTFAFEAHDKSITTIEGLELEDGGLHPVQQAFLTHGAIQCGYCTPGIVLSVVALLNIHPNPDRTAIQQWLGAHVCRCTGYQMIVEAVVSAVQATRKRDDGHTESMQPSSHSVRVDGIEKVTGQAEYTTDLYVPGMLHGKILRSPHAHARIRRIDSERARALPGVASVVTRDDLLGMDSTYGFIVRDQPVLAIDKVRYVGDTVAAVVAEDEATAFQALSLIDVEYEVLPSVMTMEDALADDAPLLFETPQPRVKELMPSAAQMFIEPAPNVLFEYTYKKSGEESIDELFRRCDHVYEDTYTTNKVHHYFLEPYVTVAHVKRGRIEVWACNQDPFELRSDLSRMFGVTEGHVRIHTNYVGGGFGGKSFCKMEPVAVLLATKVDRPVRLCLSMDEAFHTLCKPALRITLKTGVMADGTLVARASEILVNGGAYSDANAAMAIKAGYRIGGPYRWQALDTRARCVRTNTVPAGSFRGFGGTQATFASESQIEAIAQRLGIDPFEFRMKNFLQIGEPFLPNDRPVDSDLRDGLRIVAERLGYSRRKRVAGRGMGLSVGWKDGATSGGLHGQAAVKVTADGSIIVNAGTVEIGQGAATAMCTIAAKVLNAPIEAVRYAKIDTDHTPLDPGTRGSSGIVHVGKAVELAALDVLRQVLEFAAARLGSKPEDIDLDSWNVRYRNELLPLQQLILDHFGGSGYEFIGKGFINVPLDPDAPLGAKTACWMPNWVGAEVEVDPDTGKIHVLGLVVAVDAGRAINMPACRGQIEGGAIQAYGQALFEDLKYDGDRLINGTALTYKVPLTVDLPDVLEAIVLEQGMGPGPFDAKPIGESGVLGIASAIANAVEDAVGVRIADLPLTPERVLDAIDESGCRTSSS